MKTSEGIKWLFMALSCLSTVCYIISLILSNSIWLLISVTALSQALTVFTFIFYNSFIGLFLFILFCISFDYFLLWLKRKKHIVVYSDQMEMCVYMKRNIVEGRTVVLHMGEFVQLIVNTDDEQTDTDTITVRKFNGEEFIVHKDDVVSNVEEVVGQFE